MDYLELFRRHDSSSHLEQPPGFDRKKTAARLAKFVDELRERTQAVPEVETGSTIQDASFHSDVLLPMADERHALIRFSKFGDMVTVADDEPIPEALLGTIRELLEEHGYVYVPAQVLDQPYTSEESEVGDIDTWWLRYFDYL